MAPAFARGADFAISKPPGVPCPNLGGHHECTIHDRLRSSGFPGCEVFDCFGAGQHVAQHTYGGHEPADRPRLYAVFAVMRHLHELLWHLSEAASLLPDAALSAAYARVEQLTDARPDTLLAYDVDALRGEVNALLRRTSESIRGSRPDHSGPDHSGPDHSGADLIGHDLSNRDLTGANLRGTLLIGANLTGADLRLADLTGADLRGADLAGADLSTALFVTQSQLTAARGSTTTKLPARRTPPRHWR